ncbi:hypothetical protein Acr_28g0015320 [Actinidia rufa]|uniref:Uncharacterized protein n=1 Tax=Actinidia rufa TaxID=165716 RepID=A0A7J0HCH7_9ERIC|nr:hypothetical protein Acr_28g0015320 [Actinidia rufa]
MSRKMREVAVGLVMVLLLAVQIPSGLTLQSTVPAFLWSPQEDGFSNNEVKEAVNYQTLSPKDLAKSVLSEGGWSNLLCSGKETQHPVDVALLFVGREVSSGGSNLSLFIGFMRPKLLKCPLWDFLGSSAERRINIYQFLDISGTKYVDSSFVDLLKVSFTSANFSLAFPYIAASEEEEAIESSLISEFAETCGHNFGANIVTFLESCSLDGGNYEKLADFPSLHDYLVSRTDKRQKGQADLVVFCQGNSRSESQVFSELISSMEQSGARYTVLYVSDPFRPKRYPYQELQRFLAESTLGNGSVNATVCDGVCQIKSSLLEGILVVSHYLPLP